MNPVFELKRVTKRFGRQVALQSVDLQAQSGTVMALLGENGAGKTTAIRILLGLLDPDGGTSRVFGMHSRRHGDQIRRRVGYVPDRTTLYEWMTVDEIGWFCGGFYDEDFVDNYRRLVCEYALPLRKRIGTLSRGMKAKVSLSLAMAHQPELLVLDEPTSGLDPIVRREFLESMVDVAASGRSVLLSSHQIAEVERVADVVAILHKGRLATVERLDELKAAVRELTVTVCNRSSVLPQTPGTLIHRVQQDRQWRLLVRDCQENQLEQFRHGENVRSLEVKHASLEEIYVGYMQGESAEGTA